jgi:hypothetical protein
MSKIIKRLLIIVGLLLIMLSATYAVWTDQAILGNNDFATGSLQISTTPATALFTAANIFPGWSETKSLSVNNDGSAPLNYTFLTTKSGTSTVLYNSDFFHLKVGTTSGAGDLYDGPVRSGSFITPRSLALGSSETLYVTVSLANDAGNDLQNKTATVNFVFDATI